MSVCLAAACPAMCVALLSRSMCPCREVSEGVVQKLLLLKQALDQGNLNQALSVQVSCCPLFVTALCECSMCICARCVKFSG